MALFRKKQSAGMSMGDTPVMFKHADAQRIANVVHSHESSRRGRSASTLPRAPGGGGSGFATAKFTGAWAKDTLKTITFLANTTETAIASNITSHVPPLPESSTHRRCTVAQEGTTWILLTAECP